MKKLLFLLLPAVLLIQACSNDFEVTAPWKEIPAVYGILSPKDTAHYLRVEKAFLDPETNALEIAQIADSLYYPENAIDVYLERVGTGQQIQLQRVDGNLEGYVRQGGVFATQPNWLYKTKETLQEGETYRFRMIRADGKPDVTAETTLPATFNFQSPNPQQIPPQIGFSRAGPTTIVWRTDANGVYFRIDFQIRYREETPEGAVIRRDTLHWTPVYNTERSETPVAGGLFRAEAKINAEAFFNFLVENIPPASDRFRYFDGIDITITGGGKEIKEYQERASANSGLTGAEIIPVYTNLSEGFGLFTGKNFSVLNKIQVSPQSINAMNEQSPVKDLNFRN